MFSKSLGVVLVLLSCLAATSALGADAPPHNATRLNEVVVTATRTEKRVDEAPASVTVITAEDLQKFRITTVDEALKHEAGIYVRRPKGMMDTTPDLVIRGQSGASRNLILVDGVPMNDGYSAATQWNNIPMGSIERIEVIKGPGSALYGGNAMGGVVNIITRKVMNRTAEVSGGIGTDDTYTYGVRLGDRYWDALSLSLGFEDKETGGYPTSLVTKSMPGTVGVGRLSGGYDTLTNAGAPVWVIGDKGDNWAKNRLGTLAGTYNATDLGTLGFTATYGRYEYGYDSPHTYNGNYTGRALLPGGRYASEVPSDFISSTGMGQYDTTNLAMSYDNKFGDIGVKLKAGYQDKNAWYTLSSGGGRQDYDTAHGNRTNNLSQSVFTDAQADIPLFGKHLLTVGGAYRGDQMKRENWNVRYYREEDSLMGDKTDQETGKSNMYSAFAQYEWPVLERLTLYGGARFDYWEVYDLYSYLASTGANTHGANLYDSAVSPKVSAVWNPLDDSYLRGSVAQGFRPPTIYDLASSWVSGSTTYLPNPNLKPETLTTYELGGDQYFWDRKLRLSGAVFHTDMVNAIQSIAPTAGTSMKTNVDEATIDGYELEASVSPFDWVRLWTNYTYNYAIVRKNNDKPATEGKRMTYVPEDVANVGAEFTYLWARFNIAGTYTGRIYSTDTNTDVITDVPGGYTRTWIWDAKLTVTPWEGLDASLAVDNLLDEKYYVGSYVGRPRSVFTELKYKF
jgi:iron complex outermembrane receptor protein